MNEIHKRFDEQNFDELIVKHKGKNLDKSLAIRQICESFHHQTFVLYSILRMMVVFKSLLGFTKIRVEIYT